MSPRSQVSENLTSDLDVKVTDIQTCPRLLVDAAMVSNPTSPRSRVIALTKLGVQASQLWGETLRSAQPHPPGGLTWTVNQRSLVTSALGLRKVNFFTNVLQLLLLPYSQQVASCVWFGRFVCFYLFQLWDVIPDTKASRPGNLCIVTEPQTIQGTAAARHLQNLHLQKRNHGIVQY